MRRNKPQTQPGASVRRPASQQTNYHFGAPFSSKYPVEEGSIIKILSPKKWNRKRPVYFTLYVWVMQLMMQYPKGIRRTPKNRPVKVTYLYVPIKGDRIEESFVVTKVITARRIRRMMHSDGYEILPDRCEDKRDIASIRRFYRTMRVIRTSRRKHPGSPA